MLAHRAGRCGEGGVLVTCKFPGCGRAVAVAVGRGPRPRYCDNPAHNARTRRTVLQRTARQATDTARAVTAEVLAELPPEGRVREVARQLLTCLHTTADAHAGQAALLGMVAGELDAYRDPDNVEARLVEAAAGV